MSAMIKKKITINSRRALEKVLPFREPFLFIDKMVAYSANKKVVTQIRLTGKEWYLKGHFPGNPVMPGHLIAEAMIQTGSLLFGKPAYDEKKGRIFYLTASKTRFFEIIKPGDVLRITAKAERLFSIGGIISVEAYKEKKLVAKGEFTVALRGEE